MMNDSKINDTLDLIVKQNKVIISLLGRLAFPEDKLRGVLIKNAKRPEQMVRAYNLCNGERTTAEITKKLNGVTGRALNIATERWEQNGIAINLGGRGTGKEIKPFHLYPIGSDKNE